jgi:fructose 1,6-bisphosphatase
VEEIELRCENGIKFGELFPVDEILEVKCRSTRCGAAPGLIVIHGFDVRTGKLVGTETFRDPAATQRRE